MTMSELLAGGAEKTALELVGALAGRGYEFVVASMRRSDGVSGLGDAFAAAGATVYEGLARRRLDPLATWRLARIIRRHEIDVMLVVDVPRNAMFHSFLAVPLSGRKIPRLCWCKSMPGGQSGRFWRHLRAYKAFCKLAVIICTSRLQRNRLIECGLSRRHMPLIRNGVNLQSLPHAGETDLPLPKGKRIIVQVANVMPDKDHATLIAAAEKLAVARDDFHLVLAGRGTDSPSLADSVRRAGLTGRISLAGYRQDIPAILAAADLFVLSTRSEVFSVAILEAMAAGVCVVTSDIPAMDEVFTHRIEGLKFPPGDGAALAGAIAELLDDTDLRLRLAAAGGRRAGRFGLLRMAAGFDRLLRVLGNKH
ncbi:MAG: glycosyltransferase [Planctomycetota bacterium]|nr:glycosyltransferase [Planctomycetota bacterium]